MFETGFHLEGAPQGRPAAAAPPAHRGDEATIQLPPLKAPQAPVRTQGIPPGRP